MALRSDQEQVLYDVISHMLSNVVTSLRKEPVNPESITNETLAIRAKAAKWGESFLEKLDSVYEYKRFDAALTADLKDGSWQLRIKAIKKVYTVDYRDGDYLLSTMGEEFFQVGMSDPNHPTVRRG
jgi:hypothetical protein